MQINIRNAGSFGAVTKCGNVRVRKTVFTVVLALGVLVILAAFISFIALSATSGSGGGNETMQYIFIPFAVFGACAVTMPFLFMMRARYTQLVALADRIEAKDATVIASLAVVQTVQAFEAMKTTVRALIDGGSVKGYEIVGDEVVAKTSLSLTEEDARRMYDEFIALALPATAAVDMMRERTAPRYCPACGAPVKDAGAKFCESCGVRLNGGE